MWILEHSEKTFLCEAAQRHLCSETNQRPLGVTLERYTLSCKMNSWGFGQWCLGIDSKPLSNQMAHTSSLYRKTSYETKKKYFHEWVLPTERKFDSSLESVNFNHQVAYVRVSISNRRQSGLNPDDTQFWQQKLRSTNYFTTEYCKCNTNLQFSIPFWNYNTGRLAVWISFFPISVIWQVRYNWWRPSFGLQVTRCQPLL